MDIIRKMDGMGALASMWTPRNISGFSLWAKAQNISAANGAAIQTWADQSGNGNDLVQNTAGSRLYYRNNLEVIGASVHGNSPGYGARYMTVPAGVAINLRNCSIFMVGRPMGGTIQLQIVSSSGADNHIIVFSNGKYGYNDGASTILPAGIKPPMRVEFYGTVGGSGAVTVHCGAVSATGTVSPNTDVTGGAIFAKANGTYPAFFEMIEYLVFNRALTDAEVTQLKNYYSKMGAVRSYANQVVFCGDSITEGYYLDTTATGNNYPWQVLQNLDMTWQGFNLGLGGTKISEMVTNNAWYTSTYDATRYPFKRTCVVFAGTNDLKASVAAATVYANIKSFCTTMKATGYTVIVVDVLPRSDAGVPGGFSAARASVNGSLAGDFTAATANALVWGPAGGNTYGDYLVRISGDATMGPDGSELSATYYVGKVHPTAAGYVIIGAPVTYAINL